MFARRRSCAAPESLHDHSLAPNRSGHQACGFQCNGQLSAQRLQPDDEQWHNRQPSRRPGRARGRGGVWVSWLFEQTKLIEFAFLPRRRPLTLPGRGRVAFPAHSLWQDAAGGGPGRQAPSFAGVLIAFAQPGGPRRGLARDGGATVGNCRGANQVWPLSIQGVWHALGQGQARRLGKMVAVSSAALNRGADGLVWHDDRFGGRKAA